MIAFGVPLVDGAGSVFEESSGAVCEFSLNFRQDSYGDLIGGFGADIEANGGMDAVDVFIG